MRQGILSVSNALLEELGGRELAYGMLPAEHYIVAERPCDGYTDWLIQGPDMPEVGIGGHVHRVLLLVKQDFVAHVARFHTLLSPALSAHSDRSGITVTAWWDHLPLKTWVVKPL